METKEAIEQINELLDSEKHREVYGYGNNEPVNEALDLAITILTELENGSYLINDNFTVSCPNCDGNFPIGRGYEE